MTSLKKDSCSKSNFSLDKEEFTRQSCPKVKTEGIFDRVVKETIQEEKNKKKSNLINNNDPELLTLYKEAQTYKNNLDKIIFQNQVTTDEAVELISLYIESVLFPIRDLLVIKRSYLSNQFANEINLNNLQLKLPDGLIRDLNQDQNNIITQGPNPSASPFYMELIPSTNGNFQTLAFSPSDIIRRDVLTLMKAPTSKNYVLSLKWMTLHMMLSQVYLYDTILGSKSNIQIPNSCQNHFNGNLPNELKFKVEEGVGDQYLDNILAGHGLTFKQDDASYLDYYIDNINVCFISLFLRAILNYSTIFVIRFLLY
jgi:hypothetical protein